MQNVDRHVTARQSCWPTTSLADYRLAPFHVLATEGQAHMDKNNVWHMETLAEVCRDAPELLLATPFRVVEINDAGSQQEGIRWWEEITSRGGEGMVVKPIDFVDFGPKGLVQPAIKCRGPEYLRIIYGPEYLAPGNLDRL